MADVYGDKIIKMRSKNTPRCRECSLLIYSKKRIKTKNKKEWFHITCYKKRVIENEIFKQDKKQQNNNEYKSEMESFTRVWAGDRTEN